MTETGPVQRDCASCGHERAFETPICADGHGADCPDLACTACGAALQVGCQPERRPAYHISAAA